ncbi:MAG TPA: hypothetical protein VLY20_10680 [Nitrospiria bacterium]|nr:hypothetical protein [Nitrospiria bacterium]HUK57111.1 hypothetical protein [Nitrospiria bacterium]
MTAFRRPGSRFTTLPIILCVFTLVFLFSSRADDLSADTVYDCNTPENLEEPTTIEIVLAQKWKGRGDEIKHALGSDTNGVKVRLKFFPFLDPPANIGIGKCVTAENGRRAIHEAVHYLGKIDRLIRQDILPHHWVMIGTTDVAELAWISISPDDLTRLTDPALSTDQFQTLYRQLAAPREKKLPFGMGSEKIEEKP